MSSRRCSAWYLAAGYALPAGIEAYLLHYATELRHHGFDTWIIVFEPLPKVPHRFLVALRERGIAIESLFARVQWRETVVQCDANRVMLSCILILFELWGIVKT